ncbi:FkbM family methyltransferase [Actinocorallia sp. A-T 12471]|uniref:FkbM family methyltransferase n=1 Tax=Actinocorallia sp. A-T 12471 TaxID=3089813 RepID=UPI0029CF33F3|nr:FkbM family methyltransferase [Actinocorallia sp. A-T 12471]MDX6741594.1 FkbM family methyltransferase [Actinocorallia sp. A-T 12471]
MSDRAESLAAAEPVADVRLGSYAGEYVRWEERLCGLMSTLGVAPRGVVQVGAHRGQEIPALAACGFGRMVLVEPNPDLTSILEDELTAFLGPALSDAAGPPVWEVVRAAAGRARGRAVLHVTEYDQQSSLFAPVASLAVRRRDITPVVPVHEVQEGCNVLVADVQGAELEVLHGTDLDRIDLAVVEGSAVPRYRGGATLASVADFLRGRGWRQVAEYPHARPGVSDVAWLAPRPRLLPAS